MSQSTGPKYTAVNLPVNRDSRGHVHITDETEMKSQDANKYNGVKFNEQCLWFMQLFPIWYRKKCIKGTGSLVEALNNWCSLKNVCLYMSIKQDIFSTFQWFLSWVNIQQFRCVFDGMTGTYSLCEIIKCSTFLRIETIQLI